MAASAAIWAKEGGLNRAWASFITASSTDLFLVISAPILAPQALYLLLIVSIKITCSSTPFRCIALICFPS